MNIGLVGVGKWGKNYIRTLTTLNNSHLFITDANPEVRADLGNHPDVKIIRWDDMLADSKIKAVIIATPDNTHYQLALQALQQGKDVLVEKPMALTPDEADLMLKLSQERELILMVGHTALYTLEFEKLRERVACGRLGKIIRAETVRTAKGRADVDIFNDLLPHCLAMAIKLWGQPVAATTIEATTTHVVYHLNFAGDAPLTGTARWQQPPFIRRFTVLGSQETAVCNELTGNSLSFNELPLTRECQDFISCCRTRRPPLSDGALGVMVTRTISRLKTQVKPLDI